MEYDIDSIIDDLDFKSNSIEILMKKNEKLQEQLKRKENELKELTKKFQV